MSARCARSARSAPMARFSSRCCNVARRDLTTSDEVQRAMTRTVRCKNFPARSVFGRKILVADCSIWRTRSAAKRTFRADCHPSDGQLSGPVEKWLIQTNASPRILAAERMGEGIFIEFDDGKSEFYAASILYTALPMACRVPDPAGEGEREDQSS